MSLRLELIQDLDGIHACERLQKDVWGFSDLSIIPHHVVLTSIHAGGILVGAFDSDELIGFAYSFPGFFNDDHQSSRSYIIRHCSLMAAVRPKYQFQGIGYQLKLKQRENVLEQGVQLITWTFDPLQSANARFNFGKLGAIARAYSPDLYGDMRDELNKGLPTDRFTVEWWIDSPRVKHRPKRSNVDGLEVLNSAPLINKALLVDGSLTNSEVNLSLSEPILLLEVPDSLANLKQRSLESAQRWRMETREIFSHYLSDGYLVTDLIVQKNDEARKIYYVLENRPLDAVLTEPHED